MRLQSCWWQHNAGEVACELSVLVHTPHDPRSLAPDRVLYMRIQQQLALRHVQAGSSWRACMRRCAEALWENQTVSAQRPASWS
jgi:hypothetical protein